MPWMIIVLLTGVLAGGALGLLGAWFALDLKQDEGDELMGSEGKAFLELSQPMLAKEPSQSREGRSVPV